MAVPSTLGHRMNQFAPGEPIAAVALLYQVLEGRVFTLATSASGATERGEVSLNMLEAIAGRGDLAEGWYDGLGNFLGKTPPGRAAS